MPLFMDLVSELVRDLGIQKGFSLDEAGERVLKGYAEPMRVFELLRTRNADGSVQTIAHDDRPN